VSDALLIFDHLELTAREYVGWKDVYHWEVPRIFSTIQRLRDSSDQARSVRIATTIIYNMEEFNQKALLEKLSS
jgi:hypothetical protein